MTVRVTDARPAPEADQLLDGLNPQQRKAILHEGSPLLIVAGAGSGKTAVLTRR
ncbi:MAG: UvrD-helicase domain-containing protein, partial [Mycobacterium sp.]|nr:UvrD-helicase domain-containing protein [Mycobacterium sp.]